MSGECDKCGEHTLECTCSRKDSKQEDKHCSKCKNELVACVCMLKDENTMWNNMGCFTDQGWKDSRIELPPLGEVIEGIGPKGWLYSNLGRDYFSLVEINNHLTWITPSLNDIDYKDLKIIYWRHLPPDHKGKKAFVKIKKIKNYWTPKVIFEKVN